MTSETYPLLEFEIRTRFKGDFRHWENIKPTILKARSFGQASIVIENYLANNLDIADIRFNQVGSDEFTDLHNEIEF